jgi:hypothetical protein
MVLGESAGLDFNSVIPLTERKLTTNEGATISDKDGNYFYTDGSFFTTKP